MWGGEAVVQWRSLLTPPRPRPALPPQQLAGSMICFQGAALVGAIVLKLGLRGSARFAPPEGKAVLYDFAGNGSDTACCC